MNRDLFTTISEGRGERCADLARRLCVSPATVRYVWDHEAELRAAFDPPIPPPLRIMREEDDQHGG